MQLVFIRRDFVYQLTRNLGGGRMAALNNCDGYPFALWQGLIPKYQFNFKYIAWISNRCLMGVTIGAAGTTFTVYYIGTSESHV